MMKHCSKCFEVLPMNSNYFYKDKRVTDGLFSDCKGCRKQYYKKTKEEIKKRSRDRYWKKRPEILVKKRQYYHANRDDILIKKSVWRNNNREQISDYMKQYYRINKEKIRESRKITINKKAKHYRNYKRRHREANREMYRLYSRKYDNKKRSLSSTFTIPQWQQCLAHFNHQCAYCDCTEKLEQEHVIPVSKGGHYTVDNIIPACRSCNASKNNKSLDEWYVNHQSYSTLRMDFIKDYLESNSLPILKEA